MEGGQTLYATMSHDLLYNYFSPGSVLSNNGHFFAGSQIWDGNQLKYQHIGFWKLPEGAGPITEEVAGSGQIYNQGADLKWGIKTETDGEGTVVASSLPTGVVYSPGPSEFPFLPTNVLAYPDSRFDNLTAPIYLNGKWKEVTRTTPALPKPWSDKSTTLIDTTPGGWILARTDEYPEYEYAVMLPIRAKGQFNDHTGTAIHKAAGVDDTSVQSVDPGYDKISPGNAYLDFVGGAIGAEENTIDMALHDETVSINVYILGGGGLAAHVKLPNIPTYRDFAYGLARADKNIAFVDGDADLWGADTTGGDVDAKLMHTIAHEIGHLIIKVGHPDQGAGAAYLPGLPMSAYKERLMVSGGIDRDPNESRLLVEGLLQNLPGSESVRVLGELLYDLEDTQPPVTKGFSPDAFGPPPNALLAVDALRSLLDHPPVLVTGPQFRQRDLPIWQDWYEQIKAGKRTFRFKDDPSEYDLDGPATKAALGRIEKSRRRNHERKVGIRKGVPEKEETVHAGQPVGRFPFGWIAGGLIAFVGAGWIFIRKQKKL